MHRNRPAAQLLLALSSLTLATALPFALQAGEAARPIVRDISSRREIFVDHWLIDNLDGARLKLHHPTPREVVLKFDKPWEGRFSAYVTVLKDADIYRMYYRGWRQLANAKKNELTCVAQSRDGITWTKPKLGLVEIDGSKDNNVFLCGEPRRVCHNFCPFLDTRPGVAPAERYKAVGGLGGLLGYTSPDGIHWKRIRDKPIITKGAFDSQNLAFWSPAEQRYVSYFRIFYKGKRGVARATSKDFLTWSDPVRMTYGDTPLEHLYTNQTHPYFNAPHIYISLPGRIVFGRRLLTPAQIKAIDVHRSQISACSDGVLLTTRGGSTYDRTFMQSFIRPGPGIAHWTARSNYPALGVVPTGPREMSIYMRRSYATPAAHMQRFTLRTDGFASVHAPYKGGEMLTKPFTFTGKQLEINVATSAAGSIRIEIQDANGKALPGYALADCPEIFGDDLARIVTWKAKGPDVAALAGKPIRLRVVLKDADLYAIQFH